MPRLYLQGLELPVQDHKLLTQLALRHRLRLLSFELQNLRLSNLFLLLNFFNFLLSRLHLFQ
jgi:hypothetical protein